MTYFESQADRAGRAAWVEPVLFWACILLHLLPIWLLTSFPTQDGPSHEAMAYLVRTYDQPAGRIFHDYFVPSPGLSPNALIFVLMARVLGFVSVPTAAKLVISAYVVLLPLAYRYVLRTVAPDRLQLSYLAFPFIYSWPLNMGFLNFCLSLAAFFFALGFWWRHERSWRVREGILFGLLALGVYFCHVVSFVMLLGIVATATITQRVLDRRRALARPSGPHPLWSFVPGLLLVISFALRQTDMPVSAMSIKTKVRTLVMLDSLVSLNPYSLAVAALLAATVAATTAVLLTRRLRTREPYGRDSCLLALVVSLAAYAVAPAETSGGAFLVERLCLYVFLLAGLWIATCPLPVRTTKALASIFVASALGLLLMFWPRWRLIDDALLEAAAAGQHIDAGRTVLCLVYSGHGTAADGSELAFRVRPFLHVCGNMAATKPIVDLLSYEANSRLFPMMFRADRNPYSVIGSQPELERQTPRASFLTYPSRTGGQIDYVLLWQFDHASPHHPDVASVVAQLADAYALVYVSPNRLVQLYARREADPVRADGR
ncbi:MAG: hypothetical protein ABI634_04475 [Acidobacteriota bacterium]